MPVCKALQYIRYGDPRHVLKLVQQTVPDNVHGNEVLVRWVSTPIDPLDIGIINGRYPSIAPPPCIGGSEGLGVVEKIGSNVKRLAIGAHVIPLTIKHPTWTNYAILKADELRTIDKKIKIEFASTLLINPPTAYCLLREFVKLRGGDYIIQNCAHSSVGQYVIQLAKIWGFRTLNLIRDRGEVNKKIRELTELGGDYVLTETEFMKNRKDVLKNLYEPVKLALNGVGGRSALVVASALEHGGTVVSYGEMSGENAQFSTSSFIFNDIIARGFAIMNFYNNPENATKCDQIFHDLQELYKQNRLKSPDMDKWGMQDYSKAIEHAVDHGHPKQLIIEDTVL